MTHLFFFPLNFHFFAVITSISKPSPPPASPPTRYTELRMTRLRNENQDLFERIFSEPDAGTGYAGGSRLLGYELSLRSFPLESGLNCGSSDNVNTNEAEYLFKSKAGQVFCWLFVDWFVIDNGEFGGCGDEAKPKSNPTPTYRLISTFAIVTLLPVFKGFFQN
ncbi:hypothetical protein M8C21_023398 [Ambrosia artemisiifolia]|uniref:Uncharacterized protein n=1 Tax=Ambrosia artemisiifolia TaxID=4212 RepID=A0AAD5D2T0_AMBAR|nr:hypothetical protein M8C21_023398 [Ambrosia artemisiifolia]